MLKLDRLELSGFKSFVDPVELRFAGGVTGIVGPNGCGKSNLSDAITWVLGEQSAADARRHNEDVIFNGSEKRKPPRHGARSRCTHRARLRGRQRRRPGDISRASSAAASRSTGLNGKLVRLRRWRIC
jgi:chromosome segregation ATPase